MSTIVHRAISALFLISLWTLTAAPSKAQTASKPVSAVIINPPANITEWEVGDIDVTYSDGHKEVVSKGDKGGRPQIAKNGDIGWSVWIDTNSGKYEHTGELLRIRLHDGTTKDFKPNSRFIEGWHFVDNDSAIVIVSMDYHGPGLFIKYDLITGKVLGQVDAFESNDDLPKWARPFADD